MNLMNESTFALTDDPTQQTGERKRKPLFAGLVEFLDSVEAHGAATFFELEICADARLGFWDAAELRHIGLSLGLSIPADLF